MDVARACTWGASAVAAIGAAVVVAAPAGASNRVLSVAIAFAVGALAMAANALKWRLQLWLGIALYLAGTLAILYGMVRALSLPLRLAVEGVCPPQSVSCPLGFEHPETAGENIAVYAATVLGATALLLAFIAVEARFVHPRRWERDRGAPV